MIQDRAAHQISQETKLEVVFERGGHKDKYGRTLKRGYWIVGGCFLGDTAASARKVARSVVELVAITE